jgi:predicted HD phosphohydrolase
VRERPPRPGVDGILDLLATGARLPLDAATSVTHLDHALQTAALLGHECPDDPELAVAGLVHDLGHLLPGVGDAAHATAGATAVRTALGARVAGLVALHVEAKRYLVATVPAYRAELGHDSVVSLGAQGGALSPGDAEAFAALPLGPDAAALRRADDRAKVEGLVVQDLRSWVPIMRGLSERGGRDGGG